MVTIVDGRTPIATDESADDDEQDGYTQIDHMHRKIDEEGER
jgi:hypothetical protein